ncbi:MAG: septal ring lytic transglycosylase RlpA family protein [Alphaproteobacteria bacterium]|nr:septal ring lytic transglycosylase RlpA family protein [Alphaproteobacteria bacterium]
MQKIKLLWALPFVTCMLTGCSENGFWFRSGSDYDDISEQSVYYVGAPYRIKGVLYTPKEDMNYSEKGVATWYSRDSQNRLTTNGEIFDDEKMTAAHKTLPLPSLVRITNLENGNTAIVRVNDRGPAVNNRLIDVSRKTAEALEMPETGTTLVQVDILPDESRRLKEGLEEYKDPNKDEILEKRIPVGSSEPIYKPDDTAPAPIYNGAAKVEEAELEPIAEIEKPIQKPQPVVQAKPVPAATGNWRIQAGVFGKSSNADKAVSRLGEFAPVSTAQSGNFTTVYVGPFKNEAEARAVLNKVKSAGYSDAWIKQVK